MVDRPLGNRVLVKPLEAGAQKGLLYIPETGGPSQGEVVSRGNGYRDNSGNLIPLEVNVGDVVLFDKKNGIVVPVDGVEYVLLAERDILLVR